MKSDIQIAREKEMLPIEQVYEKIGVKAEHMEFYGRYKAKVDDSLYEELKNKPDGKLVLVTAINPTPAGEGKTTTTIGLSQALNKLGKKSAVALREPSLGPCMGVKGGATGGGYSQVVPMEDINLHFTGDIHAITCANNVLSSIIDNHIQQGNALKIDTRRVTWKRALDLNDRALRNVIVGLGGKQNGFAREESFQITVASEIMAIVCLCDDLKDLKKRLGRIIIGYNTENKQITAKDLKADGAMAALLKDAIKPNLVQTLENTPAVIHGGPFANIAHGCNSIRATRLALKLCDITVTEAGFGADLGAEKFFDIKCRIAGLKPDAAVLVATVRALKYNGGIARDNLSIPDVEAVRKGFVNLRKHIENLQKYKVPVVVALNAFTSDSEDEISFIREECAKAGATFALSEVWAKGGEGGLELAQKVLETLETKTSAFKPLYENDLNIEEKIETVCKQIYGASKINYDAKAAAEIKRLNKTSMRKLPVCIAKTQYSLSDDPSLLGRPEGFTVTVREARPSAGAGFIVVLLGDIMTMPGLPKQPAAEVIDIDENGNIIGLF